MPTIDCQTREVGLRFAIVGAIGSGKRTILRRLRESLPASERAELMQSAVGKDEVISFDFAPGDLLPLAEYRARGTILVFTGALGHTAACVRAFGDLDALLLVVDSRRERFAANLEALRSLRACRSLREVPAIIFYNFRDSADALPIERLQEGFNPAEAPHHAGIAVTGEGLHDVLPSLTRATFESAQ